jgi:hypothetical protein
MRGLAGDDVQCEDARPHRDGILIAGNDTEGRDATPRHPHEVGMSEHAARWPDFLVIGAAKAGTTALFKAIGRHPRVFLPSAKEPRYFAYPDAPPTFNGPYGAVNARRVMSDRAAYLAMFADCPPTHLTFEASNEYLVSERAPATAARLIPSARLIVMLRHPVERAFSHFLHLTAEGHEPSRSFAEAWDACDARAAGGWMPVFNYRLRGFYGAQLSRWLDHFPREQLLVLFYEDWRTRPADVLAQVWQHVGLEPIATPAVTKENVSSRQPRWRWLNRHMTNQENPVRRLAQRTLPLRVRDAITAAAGAINLTPGPTLDPALRARLAVTYADDLTRVEAITGRDLTAWRS